MKKQILLLTLLFLSAPCFAPPTKPPVSWTTPRYIWSGVFGAVGTGLMAWRYKKMRHYRYKIDLIQKLLTQKPDDKRLLAQLKYHKKKHRLYKMAFWAGAIAASAGAGIALDTFIDSTVLPANERRLLGPQKYDQLVGDLRNTKVWDESKGRFVQNEKNLNTKGKVVLSRKPGTELQQKAPQTFDYYKRLTEHDRGGWWQRIFDLRGRKLAPGSFVFDNIAKLLKKNELNGESPPPPPPSRGYRLGRT